ncbi:hypothetical protein ABTM49_20695, partial [Acinetobacter baumannii]
MREPHYQWTHEQLRNEQVAKADPIQRVSFNHGQPGVLATPRPAALHAPGIVTQARLQPEAQPLPRAVPHAPVVTYETHG